MDTTEVWIGLSGIMIAVLGYLVAVYHWERKQITDERELEYLEELTREHEQGIADNREKLTRLIRMIERNHAPSATLTARLDRARRLLRETSR
jgi:hypothetical protein